MATTDPTEALRPLAAVIEQTLRATPVQLGAPEGITDLTAALTTAVALYTARHVLPPGALDDLRRAEAQQAEPEFDPDRMEFRVSPDRRQIAIWEPGNEPWFIPEPAMRGRFVKTVDMDRMGWTRYLPTPAEGSDH
ncbi:hypothetical protein [Streptomyces cucumeris]|uniref:hypothetical protein n=1 Tax=Streptomyces cucumeris TaxID=2962890 RepID=UPI003D72B630